MQISFLQKQVEIAITCYFKQVKTSHFHINQTRQHNTSCMANSVDPDQPASKEAG